MSKIKKSPMPKAKGLATFEATIAGVDYVFTALTGSQQCIADHDTGWAAASMAKNQWSDDEEVPLDVMSDLENVWYRHQLYTAALFLERVTGESYRDILLELEAMDFVEFLPYYEAAATVQDMQRSPVDPKTEGGSSSPQV